jgi:hypothetical protein
LFLFIYFLQILILGKTNLLSSEVELNILDKQSLDKILKEVDPLLNILLSNLQIDTISKYFTFINFFFYIFKLFLTFF